MRVLVVQFLVGLFKSTEDHILLSMNARSRAVREMVESAPNHRYVMLSISQGLRVREGSDAGRTTYFDVPSTRLLWLLYLFLGEVLSRPQISVCFGIENTVVSTFASLITRSKVISVIGSDVDFLERQYRLPRLGTGVVRALVGVSLRKAWQVFVPNGRVLAQVKSLTARRAVEFKYRVSEIFKPSSQVASISANFESSPVILTVARLSPAKGLEYLVMAAKDIVKAIPSARFIIQSAYPDPRYQAQLENLMTREGVRNHFTMDSRGIPNSEMPKIYNSADLYVLPSLSEGRNSTLLEAMACGLPAVATRVGANEEAVIDGVNGFLVDPKDVKALSERIVELLTSQELWVRLSAGARRTSAWSKEQDLGELLKSALAEACEQ